jgi:hypothetical protein
LGNVVASSSSSLAYISTQDGVLAITEEEEEVVYLGPTGADTKYTDIALSLSGDMAFGVLPGFWGDGWSLESFIVSQDGTIWGSMKSVEAPKDTEYMYVSNRYIALSSGNRIWVYELNSDGYPNEHFLEFTRQGQNYFGPIVIVEGAGGN